MTKTTPNTDALRETAQEHITDLLNNNAAQIAEQLMQADDGKLAFSVRVNLALVTGKAFVSAKLSYTEKFSSETEPTSIAFCDPDPDQIKLAGVEGGGE